MKAGRGERGPARAAGLFTLATAAALVLAAGCSTTSVFETDKAHPSLEMDGKFVKCYGKVVSPYDVPDMLEDHGIDRKTVIHIRVNDLSHLREAQGFRILLARAGYSRTALVTKEHAEAWSRQSAGAAPQPPSRRQERPRVRYRSANED